jgi:hypothetical protein
MEGKKAVQLNDFAWEQSCSGFGDLADHLSVPSYRSNAYLFLSTSKCSVMDGINFYNDDICGRR